MKLLSLIREDNRLLIVEVEVVLLPGLPTIQILGLPDQVIKESMHRVRSALKSRGFEWPIAKQILVNIRPVDRKKTSRGLELAIAAGLLWETEQCSKPEKQNLPLVYGELTLSGEVIEPEDLETDFSEISDRVVLTGHGRGRYAKDRIHNLSELSHPQRDLGDCSTQIVQRPDFGLKLSYTKEQARLISIVALGEFHLLMAGSAGAGKTTLAKSILSFLQEPNVEDIKNRNYMHGWRPWIAPHHSSSALAMIGGGVPPRQGEISRAHRGILFLDELLEFPKTVQEALREPIESGFIRISRGASASIFLAQFQLLATTNLCPCGRWAPGEKINCNRSWRRCRSVLDKVSGPFFDRFDILAFIKRNKEERKVSGLEILDRLKLARQFREARILKQDSQDVVPSFIAIELGMWDQRESERRKNSTLRVARAIADLDQYDEISPRQYDEALELTYKSYQQLQSSAGV
jgi:magnesium chelatase family protein